MRVAALDLGSNSFHLLVADVDRDGHLTVVTREKEMLRLGDAVSAAGLIGGELGDRAVAAVRRLRGVAEGAQASELFACATSAIRTATDGSDLVDRIEAEAGVHVEVIDGITEARLIFEAVRAAVTIEPGPALCLDLGGGSLDVMVGDAAGLRWATSVRLGVGRLTEQFVSTDPIAKRERRAIDAHVREVLAPVAACVAEHAPAMTIGSSGTLSDLVAMARGGDDATIGGRNQLRADAAELLALHRRIIRADASERRRMPGLDTKRVELLPAGSILLAAAVDLFEIDAVTVSDWALREGIVLDAVEQHPGDFADDVTTLRSGAVAALAERCGSDPSHTDRVRTMALELFDQLASVHGLGADAREMLGYAATLHDIGQHISRKGHHKHAAYLVSHAELRGFDPEEVAALAALMRHHRHGVPKAGEERMAALDAAYQDLVTRLAAILRLADGFDRGRRGHVDGLDVEIGRDLVIVRVTTHGDPELEIWGARRRRELFERVFERDIEIVAAATTQPDLSEL